MKYQELLYATQIQARSLAVACLLMPVSWYQFITVSDISKPHVMVRTIASKSEQVLYLVGILS